MKLTRVPFDKIKDGSKRIESRLFDEKRQRIAPGDEITFISTDEPHEEVTKTVMAVYRYASFEELMNDTDPALFGWSTAAEAIEEITRFYSAEDVTKYGVAGIKLR